MRSDEGDRVQAWAVQYDDGMSLTTASEQVAHRLAEAERQRGHRVTVQRLDDVETYPRGAGKPAVPEPARPAEPLASPGPVSEPEPAPAPEPADDLEPTLVLEPVLAPEPADDLEPVLAPEPTPAPEPAPEPAPASKPAPAPEPAGEAPPPGLAREPEPARVTVPASRRRLLLYVLAAVCIVVAAALADHWSVLPRVGAGASTAQVGSPLHGPQLLPPLDQPPVTHFGH